MTKREVAELACRILALTILVLSVFQVVVMPVRIIMGIWSLVRDQPGEGIGFTMMASSLSAVLHLALVSFLWTRSGWISKQVVPDESNGSRWPHIRVADLQVAAFSTVGVVALLNSVYHLCVSVGIHLDFGRRRGLGSSESTFLDWLLSESALQAIATGVIAVCLILGSRTIVRWIRSFQTFGLKNAPANAEVIDDANASPNRVND